MKEVSFLKDNGIDVESGLALLGDMEMYEETLNDFLTEFNEKKSQIEATKKNDDMENYAILVHSLKSDSKYLGFTRLSELAYQHEMESKASHSDYVNQHYEELIGEANRIISVVTEYLGK